MAEEEPKITATEADKEGSNGKRGGKKDDVPVEELYDLSKPIPRVSGIAHNDQENPVEICTSVYANEWFCGGPRN